MLVRKTKKCKMKEVGLAFGADESSVRAAATTRGARVLRSGGEGGRKLGPRVARRVPLVGRVPLPISGTARASSVRFSHQVLVVGRVGQSLARLRDRFGQHRGRVVPQRGRRRNCIVPS